MSSRRGSTDGESTRRLNFHVDSKTAAIARDDGTGEATSPSTRTTRSGSSVSKSNRKHGTCFDRRSHAIATDDRPLVQHNYHDFALEREVPSASNSNRGEDYTSTDQRRKGPRGGVTVPFPEKLHIMLESVEADGFVGAVSWQPHGRCFVVHDPKVFVDEVMPRYFRQTKLTSFQRQLNLYGFCRLTSGVDRGGYYHELFLRGKLFLCRSMFRTRIKGTGIKAASNPEAEPDFYQMPTVEEVQTSSPSAVRRVSHIMSEEQEGKRDQDALLSNGNAMEDEGLVPPPTSSLSLEDVPEDISPDLVRSFTTGPHVHMEPPLLSSHESMETLRSPFISFSALSLTNLDETPPLGAKPDFEPLASAHRLKPFVTPPHSPPTCNTVLMVPAKVTPMATMHLERLQPDKDLLPQDDNDLMSFEGCKFHYLDSPAFDILERVHADIADGINLSRSHDDMRGLNTRKGKERKELSCHSDYYGQNRAMAA